MSKYTNAIKKLSERISKTSAQLKAMREQLKEVRIQAKAAKVAKPNNDKKAKKPVKRIAKVTVKKPAARATTRRAKKKS